MKIKILTCFKYYILKNFINILTIMTEKKKQSSESIGSGKKSMTVERQFYVCYCDKLYNSYSALYLHAKKKHNQNLTMKCLKNKKHEWSGNVKNIYFQFVQQNSHQESSSTNKKNKQKQSRLVLKKNRQFPMNKNGPRDDRNCQILQRKIQKAFNQFQAQRNKEDIQTVSLFLKFVEQKFLTADLRNSDQKQAMKGQYFDFIPNLMNDYIQSQRQISQEQRKRSVISLAIFSDWLYQNKYARTLAIEQEKYEQFFNLRNKQTITID